MALVKKAISLKGYSYLLPLLAFCIPVHDKLAAITIVFLVLNWIGEFTFGEKFQLLKLSRQRKQILLFASLYLIYTAGTLYSKNLYGSEGAFFDLEIKLSLLIFPLIFSTMLPEFFKAGLLHRILNAFVLGCLVSTVLLIIAAVYRYIHGADAGVFFYTGLSGNHHPSYLALYFSFSVVILLIKILFEEKVNQINRILIISGIIILEEMIVLLGSKAGIIGMALALIGYLFFIIINKERRKFRNAVIIVILGILFLILNLTSPQTYRRFFEAGKALETTKSPDKNAEASSEIRLLIWKAAFEIIREHPVLGVGTGDVKTSLLQKYREHGYQHAVEGNLNAHNQYLQTYIATGLAGFLVLLAGLAIPLFYCFKRRDPLYAVLVILFSLHILVESMLERQAGVVFYTFFNTLLFSKMVFQKKPSDFELPEI
ncbi:MAG: O-antigen ligase family protein [Bacteroidetes bacterium]|nr:O-antigen ligase family protein [Bacteroidota bacterium]